MHFFHIIPLACNSFIYLLHSPFCKGAVHYNLV
nr:MAG TPA: hypothetical protein [Caudoviricetes sp.]